MLLDQKKTANLAIRHKLKETFLKKLAKNPNYSLRAWADHLGIDQSYLSKVLRGEKQLSLRTIESVGMKMGLSPLEIQEMSAKPAASGFQLLEEDRFRCVSEWYHYAILELAKTKNFSSEPEDISERLGIHIEEARDALERLQRLGMMGFSAGRWTPRNHTWSNLETTTAAKKNLQRQLLEKSLRALDEVDFQDREHGSLTVAISKKRLPEFKKKLMEVRKELGEYFQLNSDLDEVYQFTVSFFPLTKIKKTSKRKEKG